MYFLLDFSFLNLVFLFHGFDSLYWFRVAMANRKLDIAQSNLEVLMKDLQEKKVCFFLNFSLKWSHCFALTFLILYVCRYFELKSSSHFWSWLKFSSIYLIKVRHGNISHGKPSFTVFLDRELLNFAHIHTHSFQLLKSSSYTLKQFQD